MHGNIVNLWVLFHNSCWMQNMSNAEHASNTKVLGFELKIIYENVKNVEYCKPEYAFKWSVYIHFVL